MLWYEEELGSSYGAEDRNFEYGCVAAGDTGITVEWVGDFEDFGCDGNTVSVGDNHYI